MASPNVLIVDDNKNYREAFRRNLMLQGYEVVEAEDSEEALQLLSERELDVLVTDLAMRHPTEGLDLIRQARSLRPHLPIIMISAVGTFEEGAEASRLGARYVISKSKIDEEIENLYRAIDRAYEEYQRSLEFAAQIQQLGLEADADPVRVATELRKILYGSRTPDTVKGDAYDLLLELSAPEFIQVSRQELDKAHTTGVGSRDIYEKVDANLIGMIPGFSDLAAETKESLRTAEYLYLHGEQLDEAVDFSRSIGFSYCFAVENEAKTRLRKKLQKFFVDTATPGLIRSLLEDNRKNVSLFFHQHLLRLQREMPMDITIDNVYQTFIRILEHGNKYKPDGLKALGIILLCFGRSYNFRKFQQTVTIDNPLGLKTQDHDGDLIQFASLLTNLQHYRNPYIHPEISEMEKLSKIRQTTFDCMNLVLRLV